MDNEDDEVPILLDITNDTTGDMLVSEAAKVPLTIITGKCCQTEGLMNEPDVLSRLPWCWQNYTCQLCLKRAAWQENCGDLEWLVQSCC